MKVIKIYLPIVMLVALISGCMFKAYPTYQTIRSGDDQWYAEIEGIKYVLWPDDDWLLLNDESDSKIGYLDSNQTSLYTVAEDDECNFIKVYEVGTDALHVPLVKENLAQEFSLERIDSIEWTKWGIHAENLNELIGTDTIKDQTLIDRFVAYLGEPEEGSLSGEWAEVGTIYCYNSNLPGVVFALDAEYDNGNIKCSGYNSSAYVVIPQSEMEDIFGLMPEID